MNIFENRRKTCGGNGMKEMKVPLRKKTEGGQKVAMFQFRKGSNCGVPPGDLVMQQSPA